MATLYVMPVPLNLKYDDMPEYSVKALIGAEFVIGEEKRNTVRLLASKGLKGKPYYLLNEHTTLEEINELAYKTSNASKVCFFSDGGTPCVSDPGYDFVNICHELKIILKPLGFESSIISALSVSGFYAERFFYAGFPPQKGDSRKLFFKNIFTSSITTVFLERPYGLKQLFSDLKNFKRRIFMISNIGMSEEHYFRGFFGEFVERVDKNEKNPFVVVLEGKNA